MVTEDREVWTTVGKVDGGIGLNWEWIGLPRELFHAFLDELLKVAGFPVPSLVYWEKTAIGGTRIDWNRMRVGAKECEFHRVDPEKAVRRIKDWLTSEDVQYRFGLNFRLSDEYDSVPS